MRRFNVYTIYEDQKGMLWIGTRGGLARLDPALGDFDRFQHDPDDPYSLSDDTIFSILEDSSGALWLGTRGGLHRFEPATGRARVWRTTEGLADDTVYGDAMALLRRAEDALYEGKAAGRNTVVVRD